MTPGMDVYALLLYVIPFLAHASKVSCFKLDTACSNHRSVSDAQHTDSEKAVILQLSHGASVGRRLVLASSVRYEIIDSDESL